MALDLEEAVLGAIISESSAMMFVADILNPEMFYTEAHRLIYTACQELSISSDPMDLVTVTAKLRKNGNLEKIGGAYYLTQLTDKVVSSVNIEYHARIISQKFMQRELIKLSQVTILDCHDETKDIFEILDTYETQRDNIVNHVSAKKEVSQNAAVEELIADIVKKAEMGVKEVTGVDTGDKGLNSFTGGWQNSNLIIVAARPAMGKTAFILSKVISAAKSGKKVGVFSLEMARSELLTRVVSSETEIPLEKIKNCAMDANDWNRLHSRQPVIQNLPIYWDDSAHMTMIELSAKAKRMKRLHGVEMIVIDYLQLLTTKAKDRYNAVSDISRGLKVLAKELEMPVIALSQLSRSVESRPGNSKRPMLQDLRESGSIEQDADMVLFLYRPEYYGIDEDEEGRPTAGMAEVIIAKNRSGKTGTVQNRFQGEIMRFSSWDESTDSDVITDFSFVNQSAQLPSNDLNHHANWDFESKLPDDLPF
ncbi:replicative DNA helicase [Sphingobacterium suaedae]|uniref:Replicative DNA helicase n=2 Tax=Sphingobacterium suaedae TaxID=1686402 RepID=A0ABW5KHU7_9SPHI